MGDGKEADEMKGEQWGEWGRVEVGGGEKGDQTESSESLGNKHGELSQGDGDIGEMEIKKRGREQNHPRLPRLCGRLRATRCE